MNAWAASAWGVAVVAERELKERCNSARRWDSVTPSVLAHMKGRSYSQPPTITAGLGRSKLKSFPATLHYHARSTKRETSIMSTIDANRVIFTGENSAIRLSNNDSDSFTTNATFWRAVSSGAGSGHVLYLKSELTEARWRIYSDNIAMARLLQSTVLGAIYAELLDPTIAVIDAQFSRSGDVRDFWTERLVTRDEEVVLTWYEMGEPFLVHTQPNAVPGRPYGMCTVLVPALGARLTHNGIEAQGRPWPRQREGRPSSTCVLGLCESWTEAR
jgi:hypothetical protein